MGPSPSSVKRVEDMDAKTAQIDSLIADIVPMLGELDEQGIREVKTELEAKIRAARHALAKESTKVYLRQTEIRHPGGT